MKSGLTSHIELRTIAAQIISRIRNSPTPHLMSDAEIDARIAVARSLQYQHDDVPVAKLLNGVIGQHRMYRRASDEQLARTVAVMASCRTLDPVEVPLSELAEIVDESPAVDYLCMSARLFNAVHRQDKEQMGLVYDELLTYAARPDADDEGVVFCMRYLPPTAAMLQRKTDFTSLAVAAERVLGNIDQRIVPQWVVTMTYYTDIWNRIVDRLFQLSSQMTNVEASRSPKSAADLELILTNASLESGHPINALAHGIDSYLAVLSLGSGARMYHRSAAIAALPMLVSGVTDGKLVDAALRAPTDDTSYRYCCYELMSPAIVSADRVVFTDLLVRHAMKPPKAQHQVALDRPVYHLIKDLNARSIDPEVAESSAESGAVMNASSDDYTRELVYSHLAGMFAIDRRSDKVCEYAGIHMGTHGNVHSAWFHVARRLLAIKQNEEIDVDLSTVLLEQLELGVNAIVDDLLTILDRDEIVSPRFRAQDLLQQLKDERSETLQQYRAASRELSELRDTLASEVEDRQNALRSLESGRSWLVNELTKELALWRHVVETRLGEQHDRESASAISEMALTQIKHLNHRLQLI